MEEIVERFNQDIVKLIPNYKHDLTATTITLLRNIYIAKETEEDYDRKRMLDNLWINNIINIQKNICLDDEDINSKKNTIK